MTRRVLAPADELYGDRVRNSFQRQEFMKTLGAELMSVAPGEVTIRLPVRPALTQQHGFVHAAAVAAIGDSACGYAAFSLMPDDAAVLSIEFRIHLLAPARGDELIARGRVIKAGRTVTVCQAEITALSNGEETLVAMLSGTMMTIRDRPELHH